MSLKSVVLILSFVFNILYFDSNFLRQIFQLLHTLSYTGTSGLIFFVVKFLEVSF